MTDFNEELADKEFYRGKRYLDSGRYAEAIEIYDNLLKSNEKFAGQKEADILLETSLNNRGVARCQKGLWQRNRSLYESGMADFERSIQKNNRQGEEQKWLTAYYNLEFSKTQIQTFDKEHNNRGINFLSI